MAGPWEAYQQQATPSAPSSAADGPWTKFQQQAPANPQATQDSSPGIMDDNGLLGRIDAAIGGPGNTIRQPLRDIANVAKPIFDYTLPGMVMNAELGQAGINPNGDQRGIGQRLADTAAGITGLAWRAGTPNGEGPGDFLRTIGAPDAAKSVDQAEQNFQQYNRPGLESLQQLGFAAGGLAPDPNLPAAIRTPSTNSAVAKVSPTLGEAASIARNPDLQALREVTNAIQKDSKGNGVDLAAKTYQMMTPTPEPGSSIPQGTINRIIDLHGEGLDANDIAPQLGIAPNVAQTYIDKFHNEIDPKFSGQNLFESLKTPKDKEVVSTRNLYNLVYDAANSPGEGQAKTQQMLLQRQADQADDIEGLIDKTTGSENYDLRRKQLELDRKRIANDFYTDFDQAHPDFQLPKSALGPMVNHPVFQDALQAAREDAMWRDEPFSPSRAVDTMQRYLRRVSQSTSDPRQAFAAGGMRDRLLDIADQAMEEFAGIRNWYRNRIQAEDAADAVRKMGPNGGNSTAEGEQLFRQTQAQKTAAQQKMADINSQIIKKYGQGGGTSLAPGQTVDPEYADLQRQYRMAKQESDMQDNTMAEIKAALGQSMKDLIEKKRNADNFLSVMESRQAQRRTRAMLGDDADPFLDRIEAEQRKKRSLSVYGNSQTEPRANYRNIRAATRKIVGGILGASPETIGQGIAEKVGHAWQEKVNNGVNEIGFVTDPLQVRELVRRISNPNVLYKPQPKVRPVDVEGLRRASATINALGNMVNQATGTNRQ